MIGGHTLFSFSHPEEVQRSTSCPAESTNRKVLRLCPRIINSSSCGTEWDSGYMQLCPSSIGHTPYDATLSDSPSRSHRQIANNLVYPASEKKVLPGEGFLGIGYSSHTNQRTDEDSYPVLVSTGCHAQDSSTLLPSMTDLPPPCQMYVMASSLGLPRFMAGRLAIRSPSPSPIDGC